jgi:hypothetical protein
MTISRAFGVRVMSRRVSLRSNLGCKDLHSTKDGQLVQAEKSITILYAKG